VPQLAWGGLAVLSVVCIDQTSKALLLQRLRLTRSVRIGGGIRLRRVLNVGWILGRRSTMTGLLLLWGLAVSSGFLLLIFGGSFGGGAADVGVGMALGGATGNVLDWLVRGEVVDFIDIGFWPVFNVADAGIVTGGVLALSGLLL
jgi:signal peptidase II